MSWLNFYVLYYNVEFENVDIKSNLKFEHDIKPVDLHYYIVQLNSTSFSFSTEGIKDTMFT